MLLAPGPTPRADHGPDAPSASINTRSPLRVTVNLAAVSPPSAGTAVIEWWPSVMLSPRCCGLIVVFILLGRRADHGNGLALLRTHLPGAVVDAEPGVHVEEVQRTRVD